MCPILFYVCMMVYVHVSACMHVHVCDIPFQFYETIVRYDKFFAAESRYIAGIMVWGICMHMLMLWCGVRIYIYAHAHAV